MQPQEGIITCSPPAVDHLDGYGYLYGYPIAHSWSPLVHQTIFASLSLNWNYFLLPSTDLEQFLSLVRDPKCYGSGVTMPNKISIIPKLDDITSECRAVGACNTVFRRGTQLVGTNTDTIGVRESFYQNVAEDVFRGRPGMVIGGGGAARSAVYALVKSMGSKTVYLVNRDADEVKAVIDWCTSQGYGEGLIHVATALQAETLEEPGAIVACVPNFPPMTEAEKEARIIMEIFLSKPRKGCILEMCYHPTPWTDIAGIAEKAGWQVVLGTEAMIYQGFEQARCWTGKAISDMPIQKVKDAIAQELSKARL